MRSMSARLLPVLAAILLFAGGCAGRTGGGAPATPVPASTPPPSSEQVLEDLERRTFDYFWTTANPSNGLIPDRYPTPSFSSIAAVGFGLTAYPIGVERGYVTRAAALERVLTTLRFFRDAPQGPERRDVTGYKGFYYHFLDMRSGLRYEQVELSTIDTALLLAGVLFCQSYFDGPDPAEAEVRQIADELYRRVDWSWAAAADGAIALGWKPESGFHPLGWHGYNEAMILYLLALGSPTSALPPKAWQAWTSTYGRTWGETYGQLHLAFPPLFGHQFSHVWVDFRGIRDDFMRAKGIDYFENSRRATYAQQAYATANPMHWKGYDERIFGISACDGPGSFTLKYAGTRRVFRGYAGRGIGGAASYDDGTIAPSAAASSIAFAPEIVLPALVEIERRYGSYVYASYGFLDAFNPSFDFSVPTFNGRRIAGFGWVDTDYLGIDEGPTVAMVENYRSGLVWRVMRRNPYLRRGLERAGFTGGWLEGTQ
jgi:hypothetical protein